MFLSPGSKARAATTVGSPAVGGTPGSVLFIDGSGKLANNVIWDVVAPVATGVQANDTANLQAAINATPNGGWLFIPRGVYQINAALSITKRMRVSGSGVHEIFTGNSLPDIPWAAPYLNGTVLVQNTAATDVIDVTGTGLSVDFSDFGMMFATGIWFSNTGHGINAIGAVVGGQVYHDTGAAKITWRNLTVFGHDGNHYGFRFLNSMHATLDTLRAYGGGIMSFEVDNPGVNYGNAVVTAPMGVVFTAGTANGYNLKGADTGTFGALNVMTFIRPQCNVSDFTTQFPASTKPTSSQYSWFTDQNTAVSGAGYVRDVTVINPSLEGDIPGVTTPLQFNLYTYVINPETDPVAYLSTKDYNTTSLPTATVQAGAGTGATASVNGGPPAPSDLSGVILLQTGTSPGSGAFTDLVKVTYGTPLLRTPKFVMLFPYFCSDSTPFMIHSYDQNGFMVMTALGSAVSASKTYDIAWLVVQ